VAFRTDLHSQVTAVRDRAEARARTWSTRAWLVSRFWSLNRGMVARMSSLAKWLFRSTVRARKMPRRLNGTNPMPSSVQFGSTSGSGSRVRGEYSLPVSTSKPLIERGST
jgi:hypothetical protein